MGRLTLNRADWAAVRSKCENGLGGHRSANNGLIAFMMG